MKLKFRILILIVFLIVIGSVGCCGSSSTYAKDSSSSSSGASTQQTDQPTIVSIHQTLVAHSYSEDAEITVDQVIRGSSANSIVRNSNQFNSDPSTGYEYLLYNVRVKNTGDNSLTLFPVNEFPTYANGVKSDIAFVVLSNDYREYSGTLELLPGAQTNGWIVAEVPIGSDVKMAYEPLIGDALGFVQF